MLQRAMLYSADAVLSQCCTQHSGRGVLRNDTTCAFGELPYREMFTCVAPTKVFR